MDLETAIQAFGSSGHDLPHEVLQWTLDHWEEVAPELLGMLERYISGADRSDEAARAIFFILHLAGEKQDTRVFELPAVSLDTVLSRETGGRQRGR